MGLVCLGTKPGENKKATAALDMCAIHPID